MILTLLILIPFIGGILAWLTDRFGTNGSAASGEIQRWQLGALERSACRAGSR